MNLELVANAEPLVLKSDVAELHKFELQRQILPVPYRLGMAWHPTSIRSLSIISPAIVLLKHPRIVSPPVGK